MINCNASKIYHSKFIPKIKKVYQLILHLSLSIDIVHSISSNPPAAPLLKNQIAMHAPAITPKSEGEPRKTAAVTDKARKKPEWVRTLQVRWLTSNALTQMA